MLGVCFASVPLVAGVAILRYRLYEIDVVVNRTLVYAAVTVILAAGFAATVVLLGTALGRGSGWATAGATLVVAVAFRPLRARVQDAVDVASTVRATRRCGGWPTFTKTCAPVGRPPRR